MIVADTSVVSELMRDEPAAAVARWAAGAGNQVTITVVTVTEIEYGLARMPEGRRKRDLAATWRRVLDGYADRLLGCDVAAAQAAAQVMAERDRSGRPMTLADAQIAGVCRSRGTSLATRNTKDFDGLGLELVDPFG